MCFRIYIKVRVEKTENLQTRRYHDLEVIKQPVLLPKIRFGVRGPEDIDKRTRHLASVHFPNSATEGPKYRPRQSDDLNVQPSRCLTSAVSTSARTFLKEKRISHVGSVRRVKADLAGRTYVRLWADGRTEEGWTYGLRGPCGGVAHVTYDVTRRASIPSYTTPERPRRLGIILAVGPARSCRLPNRRGRRRRRRLGPVSFTIFPFDLYAANVNNDRRVFNPPAYTHAGRFGFFFLDRIFRSFSPPVVDTRTRGAHVRSIISITFRAVRLNGISESNERANVFPSPKSTEEAGGCPPPSLYTHTHTHALWWSPTKITCWPFCWTG